jgi:protein ImuA
MNTVYVTAMNDSPTLDSIPLSLEQLLKRDDIWVGSCKHMTAQPAVSTGYEALNHSLVGGGWPLGSLVEVCQHGMQGEWQLFNPSFVEIPGLIALVNPPAEPFSQALIQLGIDLERLVIIDIKDKQQFIASFIELARASVGAVLAWQPDDSLTYTELRKCVLAAADGGSGINALFRPAKAQQQSSPAALRLYIQLVPAGLEVTVFKQKGRLQMHESRPITLELPSRWKQPLAYHLLDGNVSLPAARDGQKKGRIAKLHPVGSK